MREYRLQGRPDIPGLLNASTGTARLMMFSSVFEE
jgi:hypothetical protein